MTKDSSSIHSEWVWTHSARVRCAPISTQMNIKPATGTSPQGFALFSSSAAAQAAMLLLHDMQFDTDVHLRCEMAHKNMYIKASGHASGWACGSGGL